MYYPHEHNAKAAAAHVKNQVTLAKDRLKANATWNRLHKPGKKS